MRHIFCLLLLILILLNNNLVVGLADDPCSDADLAVKRFVQSLSPFATQASRSGKFNIKTYKQDGFVQGVGVITRYVRYETSYFVGEKLVFRKIVQSQPQDDGLEVIALQNGASSALLFNYKYGASGRLQCNYIVYPADDGFHYMRLNASMCRVEDLNADGEMELIAIDRIYSPCESLPNCCMPYFERIFHLDVQPGKLLEIDKQFPEEYRRVATDNKALLKSALDGGNLAAGCRSIFQQYINKAETLSKIGNGTIQTIAPTMATNQDGWASATGFRAAETNIQKNIVNAVKGLGGQASGQSVPRQDVKGGDWNVDTDSGDGLRMRNAIQTYYTWWEDSRRTKTLAQIKTDMVSSMEGTSYTSTQKGMFADRIISLYPLTRPTPTPFAVPTDDRTTLEFLLIQKQCREWVSTKVLANGGKPKVYNSGLISPASAYRPGMGLYKGKDHATIIIDIYWDKNGDPTKFKVAEANYGSGWSQNPRGMIPWARTLRTDREVKSTDGYYVVSFDK